METLACPACGKNSFDAWTVARRVPLLLRLAVGQWERCSECGAEIHVRGYFSACDPGPRFTQQIAFTMSFGLAIWLAAIHVTGESLFTTCAKNRNVLLLFAAGSIGMTYAHVRNVLSRPVLKLVDASKPRLSPAAIRLVMIGVLAVLSALFSRRFGNEQLALGAMLFLAAEAWQSLTVYFLFGRGVKSSPQRA